MEGDEINYEEDYNDNYEEYYNDEEYNYEEEDNKKEDNKENEIKDIYNKPNFDYEIIQNAEIIKKRDAIIN